MMLETYRGTVYPWHCDHMEHMNVMWYVSKFDEGTWNLFSHLGLSAAFLRQHHRGMAAVDQRISYRREMHAGDTVAVSSGIISAAERKLVFFHEMRNGESGEITAVTLLTGVHIDTRTRKSCVLPEPALAKAREMVAVHQMPWPV